MRNKYAANHVLLRDGVGHQERLMEAMGMGILLIKKAHFPKSEITEKEQCS